VNGTVEVCYQDSFSKLQDNMYLWASTKFSVAYNWVTAYKSLYEFSVSMLLTMEQLLVHITTEWLFLNEMQGGASF